MITLSHFSLITDMFLGVCYREADPEQLNAFTEELKQEGKLTDDTKDLMEQLEKKSTPNTKAKETKPKRYIKEGWWDPEQERFPYCRYVYKAETDTWLPVSQSAGLDDEESTTEFKTLTTRPVFHSDIKSKHKTGKRCSIM